LSSDGSTERHEIITEFPDWLVKEEERLRVLEKKRQAGEVTQATKSRVDLSTEAIASKLARPAEEVDAMVELKGAANQKELVVAQRKLARYQRIAEEKGALASKVLNGTPQWILEDARKQAEWVAEKKKEKAQRDAGGGEAVGNGKVSEPSSLNTTSPPAAEEDGPLYVECLDCGIKTPWPELDPGDGVCATCLALKSKPSEQEEKAQTLEPVSEAADAATAPAAFRSSWRGRRNATGSSGAKS
jgi:hypothetical protein